MDTAGSANSMDDKVSFSGNYRIEISGWGLNNVFFVEKTDLLWTEGEEKKLHLHHALPDGAIIFVRLIAPENSYRSVPVAYQIENVQPMNSEGLCEMRLLQLRPRSRAHARNDVASRSAESTSNLYETKEDSAHPENEEVLHEA
jgi:hypothetical protein